MSLSSGQFQLHHVDNNRYEETAQRRREVLAARLTRRGLAPRLKAAK
jgi:hypothetical protein